jgi:hypothetical protein
MEERKEGSSLESNSTRTKQQGHSTALGSKKVHECTSYPTSYGEDWIQQFLYTRKAPGIESLECNCAQGDKTVEHVLLKFHIWQVERAELMDPLRTRNLREILTERKGCEAAVRMIQRTKLLDQFKPTAETTKRGEGRGNEDEEREEERRGRRGKRGRRGRGGERNNIEK